VLVVLVAELVVLELTYLIFLVKLQPQLMLVEAAEVHWLVV
jgi:hypothetical protein